MKSFGATLVQCSARLPMTLLRERGAPSHIDVEDVKDGYAIVHGHVHHSPAALFVMPDRSVRCTPKQLYSLRFSRTGHIRM